MTDTIKPTEEIKIPEGLTVADLDMQEQKKLSALDKAFSELFTNINLELKTDFLKNPEIKRLGTLHTMSKRYGFTALDERIIKHMEMRVSLKRQGRGEAIKLVQVEREHEERLANITNKYQKKDNE